MAFWTHFSTQSSGTAILLLWGVPYLSGAQHLEHSTVALLLSGFVFFGILSGFIYSQVCAHHPNLRKQVVLIVAVGILIVFALLIAWPGATPFWLLVLWVIVVGSGGPASMIAFDYSKQYVPKNRLGATNGFINIGGFLATFVMMFLIGVTLDVVHTFALITNKSAELYTVSGFQIAFVAVLVVIGFGLWRFLVNESAVKALSSRD
jgi:MFS family permease